MTFCGSGNHSFTSEIKFFVGHFFLISGQLPQSSISLEFLIRWRNGTRQFSRLLLSKDLAHSNAYSSSGNYCGSSFVMLISLPIEFMFTRTQAVDFTRERFRELRVSTKAT